MTDTETFAQRYLAMWNEPDSQLRHDQVRSLFADNAIDFTGTRELHGHTDIEQRVDAAHDRFVAEQQFVFRLLRADGHHNAIRLSWEMVPQAGGEAASLGFDFLVLDTDGRIQLDYQFIDR